MPGTQKLKMIERYQRILYRGESMYFGGFEFQAYIPWGARVIEFQVFFLELEKSSDERGRDFYRDQQQTSHRLYLCP